MTKVEWDYSERAASYDKRADYSADALRSLFKAIGAQSDWQVADIGAGTGKLSVPLARSGLTVHAVEPNDNMRSFGVRNTRNLSVTWYDGTGEQTGLPENSFQSAFFGSSFNVVDQNAALRECARILVPNGWFICMWNHRDLTDFIQASIEKIIQNHIPEYDYGLRRENPALTIEASGLFGTVSYTEGRFSARMNKQDVIEAWKSHATVARQAGNRFNDIIDDIQALLAEQETLDVPYATRIWFAQRRTG